MGNEQPKNMQTTPYPGQQNQGMPDKNSFMAQMDNAIEQNSTNNMVNKAQFNRILSMLGLDLQTINYIPILDGLFEQIEPVFMAQPKPKYNVKNFMNSVINDQYFLMQCKAFVLFLRKYFLMFEQKSFFFNTNKK
jgi:hypothetical protein